MESRSKEVLSTQNQPDIFTPHDPMKQTLALDSPTPEDLPRKIDVSHLPQDTIRNGVLESVLDQNDDLMARLSVTLRRISSLEEQIAHYKSSEAEMRQEYEKLQDQVLVLRAKARCVQERQDDYDSRYNKLNEDYEFLQIKYQEEIKEFEIKLANSFEEADRMVLEEQKKAEAVARALEETVEQREKLIAEITERQSQFSLAKQQEVDSLINKNQRLLKYQRKIAPLAKSLRSESARFKLQVADLIQSKAELEERLVTDRKSLTEGFDFERNQLMSKLEESTQYIQSQAKNHKHEHEELVNSYEETLKELRQSVSEMKKKTIDYQRVMNENSDLNNQLVVLKRTHGELQSSHNDEVRKIQETLAEYRTSAKKLALEAEQFEQIRTTQSEEIKDLKKSRDQLSDQVESLQILWKQAQNELETQTHRNASLQKLNQQLSISLNDYRKQIKDLKAELESHEYSSSHQIDELQKQIRATALVHQKDFVEQKTVTEKTTETEENFRPELMHKIDELIGEIQSGK
ncbi:MAG: hypothetical protein KDD61_05695 [Bdellovibrionales bacterium]|nr:hypothetical protein [Bdellovibrionales bacterium]